MTKFCIFVMLFLLLGCFDDSNSTDAPADVNGNSSAPPPTMSKPQTGDAAPPPTVPEPEPGDVALSPTGPKVNTGNVKFKANKVTSTNWIQWPPGTFGRYLRWTNENEQLPFAVESWESIKTVSAEIKFELLGATKTKPLVHALGEGKYRMDIEMPRLLVAKPTRSKVDFKLETNAGQQYYESYCWYTSIDPESNILNSRYDQLPLDPEFDSIGCTSLDDQEHLAPRKLKIFLPKE